MFKWQIEEIENLIRKNLANRGLDKIHIPDQLLGASKELFDSTTVMIVTGFVIKVAQTGETDGPIGAVSLARALEQIGKEAILVTDKYSEKMLRECCRLLGIKGPLEIVPYDDADEFCVMLLEKYKPSHIVAIERPGRAVDGRCYSMRGEDITDYVSNTDALFANSGGKGITTIAVGDGGNEVGMGKVSLSIMNHVKHGEKICASISSDYLIIAGISNWGGHAIAACLSIMRCKMLLHGTDMERELLQCMIDAGAVDGCTKRSELSVDGLSMEENISMLESLRDIVNMWIASDNSSYTLIAKA